MSNVIHNACIEVANITIWENRPIDGKNIISFIEKIRTVGEESLFVFNGLGSTENDVADAIHFISQAYAIPPIQDDMLSNYNIIRGNQ